MRTRKSLIFNDKVVVILPGYMSSYTIQRLVNALNPSSLVIIKPVY